MNKSIKRKQIRVTNINQMETHQLTKKQKLLSTTKQTHVSLRLTSEKYI